MASEEILLKTLRNADGKPFAKYKGIQNTFAMDDMEISFDDVQNDKTGHTLMRVRVPSKISGFPKDAYDNKDSEIALRDLVARRFWESARTHARSPIPKTTGGEVYVPRPGQEILERGSIRITQYCIEACFTADLPSDNGKVSATAMNLLLERIRTIASESLHFKAYKESKLYNHIHTYENARYIRSHLKDKGLAAFVADGSILPRRDDDLAPMVDAVPFSHEGNDVVFDVPNGDPIRGMGIPSGFTAIAGPSGNGKSTFLDALFSGVYDHIPGDGREYVITDPTASFIMSEAGRPADSVDVSMFNGADEIKTTKTSSPASELVSISEAIEMGSKTLLVDEQYSNPCVIRRGCLSDGETITPLSELGHLIGASGISLMMVTGDISAVQSADDVIVIKDFTAKAMGPSGTREDKTFKLPAERSPVSKGMVFEKGRKDVSVTALSVRSVEIGEYRIDVPVAALFDMSQTRTVADAIASMKDQMDGSRTMKELCSQAAESVWNDPKMHTTTVRPMDIAAVLNRHPQMLAIRK